MIAFSPRYKRAFALVIGEEGGLSLDRADAGNWTGGAVGKGVLRGTKYGISAASFPTLDIPSLTLDEARALYLVKYWNALAAEEMPAPVGLLAFDTGVVQGIGFAARTIQDAVGVRDDGVIGPTTIGAVTRDKDITGLLVNIACRRALWIAQSAQESIFGAGWFRRLLHVVLLSVTPGDIPHA